MHKGLLNLLLVVSSCAYSSDEIIKKLSLNAYFTQRCRSGKPVNAHFLSYGHYDFEYNLGYLYSEKKSLLAELRNCPDIVAARVAINARKAETVPAVHRQQDE